MEFIENDTLKVGVRLTGGTMGSVYDKRAGEELLWQGEERSWTSRDVVIFPFVARLKDKKYTVGGKEYSMESHGLTRTARFEICERKTDEITIGFDSDDETLRHYPFPFRFRLTYRLTGGTLSVTFRVENPAAAPMYFGLGAHPAYKVDGTELPGRLDTSGNFLVFDGPQTLRRYDLSEEGTFITKLTDFGTHERIEFDKACMKRYKTFIFEGNCGGAVTLLRRNGRRIRFELGDVPVTAFWSHETYGGYVCVEPWFGLPDFEPPVRELKDKTAINTLAGGEKFEYTYKTVIY